MASRKTTLDSMGPTIEEAIQRGCEDLGLTRADVDVEVLDEGSRGLFGLGTRQARVRLTVKDSVFAPPPRVEPQKPEVYDLEEELETLPAPSAARKTDRPVSKMDDLALHIAQESVTELLENMHIQANVTCEYGEADDVRGTVPILVDITGDDLSVLIGKHSDTLNALQYISRLIVSKELGKPVTLVLDVEGYRSRRERQIRQLARRMAEQAVKTGRRQTLEPMPPNERRIVHIELRQNPEVTTESTGEEPHRKVTIIPKG